MSDLRFKILTITLCFFVMPPSVFFAAVVFNAFA
jgi:hypothetical protein